MNTHKIKKSLALGLLLLMAAVTATAQNVWKTDAISVKAGQDYTIPIALENKDSITAFQFDLQLPAGVVLKEGASATLNAERIDGHGLSVKPPTTENWYRFLVHNTDNKALKKNSGTLISIPVTIKEGFKSGTFGMKNVVMTNKKAEQLNYSTSFGYLSVVAKQKVMLTVSGLEQVANAAKAAEVTYSTIPTGLTVATAYYTDAACTEVAGPESRKKTGAFYVTFAYAGNDTLQALNDTLIMVVNNKKNVDLTTAKLPEASSLLQGQPLSASILSGGNVQADGKPLPGAFAWTNGNQSVTSTGLYSITFSPEDYANYATKDTLINLKVTPVYQVFVNQPENGAISVTGLKSDNLYAAGQILTLNAIPAANYKFVSWSVGGTNAETTWTVNQTTTISAVFAPITQKISFVPSQGGSLSVKAGERVIAPGEEMMRGTELSIVATPDAGNKLTSLKVNGKILTSNKYVLGDVSIDLVATFEAAVNEYPVKIAAATNGIIRLFKNDNTPIPAGTALPAGTTFKVIPVANAGYELSALLINGKAATATEYVYTGKVEQGEVMLSATFTPVVYRLTIAPVTDKGSLKITDEAGTEMGTNTKIAYNSPVIIEQPTATGFYKFVNVIANGQQIDKFPARLIVNGDLNIVANFEALTPIKDEYIISAQQSYIYNGQSKSFIVRTTQTRANDFMLTYTDKENNTVAGIPVQGGLYNVKITRPADDIYAAYSSTNTIFEKKLDIVRSKIAVTVAPEANEAGKKGKTTLYQTEDNVTVDEASMPGMYIFKYGIANADEANYSGTEYYLSKNTKTVNLNTSNMLRGATEPDGYVRITNGGLPYGAGEPVRIGTPLTIEAIPNEGFKFEKWQGRSETDKSILEVSVEEDMDLNFIPIFKGKTVLDPVLAKSTSEYNGGIQEVGLSSAIDGVQISAFLDNACTQPADLKNVGDYFIRIYRPETNDAKEVNKSLSYTITKAKPVIEKPTASDATEGQPLSEIQLLGGNAGSVPGTFAWATPTEIVKKGENEYTVTFTSADPNNENATVKVKVNGLSTTKSDGGDPDPEPPVDPTEPEEPTDPEEPTSIEQIASETLIVVRDLTLSIQPQQPVRVAVITMNGKYIYREEVKDEISIRLPQPGIYIVSFDREGMQTSRKINVQ